MIQITEEQIKRVRDILAGIPNGAQHALINATNRGIITARARSAREIAKVYQLKVGDIKRSGRISMKLATPSRLIGSITYAGNVIPLIEFDVTHWGSHLLRASVKKGGGATLNHAYTANLKYGTRVYERKTSKRDSSQQLFGPSVAHMMQNIDVLHEVETATLDTLDKRIEHEISRILNGYGG